MERIGFAVGAILWSVLLECAEEIASASLKDGNAQVESVILAAADLQLVSG